MYSQDEFHPMLLIQKESIHSLIASQMTKLSVADREKVYMDVHGIPDFVKNETPELIQESLV